MKEFLRLGPSLKDFGVEEAFMHGIDEYGDAILKLTKGKKGAKQGDDIMARRATMRNEIEREAAKRCAVLINLPILLKENFQQLVMTKEEITTSEEPPRIVICRSGDILSREENSFNVLVENYIVCNASKLSEAVLALLMAIYAFNLAYPKKCEKTLIFCQRVWLKVDDEMAIDKRILNVVSMLNQELKKKTV